MACKNDVLSANAITGGKIIWTLTEAEEYFVSVLGDVKMMSSKKVEEALVDIGNAKELSAEENFSLAALNKYVAVAHLNEDNTVKALEFFKRSIQCYECFIPSVDSEEIQDLKDEAMIYLNMCYLQNYDQLDKVAQFLHDWRLKNLRSSNGALLFLAIDELKELHGEQTEKDFDMKTKGFEEAVLYRVLACCKSLISYDGLYSDEDFFERICRQYDLGENEYLTVAKMLIRRNVQDPRILSKAAEMIQRNLEMRGIEDSCSAANILFALGKFPLESKSLDLERASKCLYGCFEIRQAKLGMEHFNTIEALFELGRAGFLQCLVSDRIPSPTDYQMMEKGLDALKYFCNGAYLVYVRRAEVFANVLEANGIFQTSVDVLTDCAAFLQHHSTLFFYDVSYCNVIWTRIGEIHLEYKKYQTALEWFLKVYNNLKTKKNAQKRSALWPKCIEGSAYCYFKMSDYDSARKFFDLGKEFLNQFSISLTDWARCCLYECEFLIRSAVTIKAEASFQVVALTLEIILSNVTLHYTTPTLYLSANFRFGFIYEKIG